MNQKPLYLYIFEMLDYADAIIPLITPDGMENSSYFMTLLYIEDILDKYGRGMVKVSAEESGQDGRALKILAIERLETLRSRIRDISIQYEFNDDLKSSTEMMCRRWTRA